MNPFKYIGGLTIQQAIKRMSSSPFFPIYDYAKEASKTSEEAQDYAMKINSDIQYVPKTARFALKYTSFNDYQLMKTTIDNMKRYVDTIYLDAEQHDVHQRENEVYEKLLNEFNKDNVLLYKTYQMYRCNSMQDLFNDISIHKKLGVKLVRGAYYHVDGTKGVLYSDKLSTDDNYNNALRTVINMMRTNDELMLLVASHNNESIQLAMKLSTNFNVDLRNRITFAQLLGMNDDASRMLLDKGFTVCKYVPYGSMKETLPYLMRRLYENKDILSHS